MEVTLLHKYSKKKNKSEKLIEIWLKIVFFNQNIFFFKSLVFQFSNFFLRDLKPNLTDLKKFFIISVHNSNNTGRVYQGLVLLIYRKSEYVPLKKFSL